MSITDITSKITSQLGIKNVLRLFKVVRVISNVMCLLKLSLNLRCDLLTFNLLVILNVTSHLG
jgi:hypothetical protein